MCNPRWQDLFAVLARYYRVRRFGTSVFGSGIMRDFKQGALVFLQDRRVADEAASDGRLDAVLREGKRVLTAWRQRRRPVIHLCAAVGPVGPDHRANGAQPAVPPIEAFEAWEGEPIILRHDNEDLSFERLERRLRLTDIETLSLFGIATSRFLDAVRRAGEAAGYEVIVLAGSHWHHPPAAHLAETRRDHPPEQS